MPTSHRQFPAVAAAVLAAGAALLTVPLVMGFWGTIHPAFDSLAHFRVHLSALVGLMALPALFFRSQRRIGAAAIVLALAAGGSALAPLRGGDPLAGAQAADGTEAASPQARYRLLHLNLRYDNQTPKEVLSLIGRTQPDVITLAEVSGKWVEELRLAEHAYSHRLICPPPTRIGGVAILSRRPFLHPSTARCLDRGALAIATVNVGGKAVDIAALHLGWPWPFEQPWQIGHIAPALQRLGATAILAGDFNAVPWSLTTRRIAEAGGLSILGRIGPTWLLRPMPDALRRLAGLPIDNILVKGSVVPFATRRLEEVGSDHLPVLFEFGLRPDAAPAQVLQARLDRTHPGNPRRRQEGEPAPLTYSDTRAPRLPAAEPN